MVPVPLFISETGLRYRIIYLALGMSKTNKNNYRKTKQKNKNPLTEAYWKSYRYFPVVKNLNARFEEVLSTYTVCT